MRKGAEIEGQERPAVGELIPSLLSELTGTDRRDEKPGGAQEHHRNLHRARRQRNRLSIVLSGGPPSLGVR